MYSKQIIFKNLKKIKWLIWLVFCSSEYEVKFSAERPFEDYRFKLLLRKPLNQALAELKASPIGMSFIDITGAANNTDIVNAIFVKAFAMNEYKVNYTLTFITDISKLNKCSISFITRRNDMLPDASCKFFPGFIFNPFSNQEHLYNVSKDMCFNQLKRRFGDIRKEPNYRPDSGNTAPDTDFSNYILYSNYGFGNKFGTCEVGKSSGCGQGISRLFVSSIIDETKFICRG